MIVYILAVLSGLVLLGADQYTKAWIAANYAMGETHDFLPGVLDLTYIHNRGGAWGMLYGHTWLLLGVTAVIMLICVALLVRVGFKNKVMFWAIVLILSGGVGNMIDRVFRDGNVVDFLHFSFFPQFPVFNVADCGVVIGAGLLILYFVLDTVAEAKRNRANRMAGLKQPETALPPTDENGL